MKENFSHNIFAQIQLKRKIADSSRPPTKIHGDVAENLEQLYALFIQNARRHRNSGDHDFHHAILSESSSNRINFDSKIDHGILNFVFSGEATSHKSLQFIFNMNKQLHWPPDPSKK